MDIKWGLKFPQIVVSTCAQVGAGFLPGQTGPKLAFHTWAKIRLQRTGTKQIQTDPNWTCKKAGPVLEPFGSGPVPFQNGPCKQKAYPPTDPIFGQSI